jgi:hypothetical protein
MRARRGIAIPMAVLAVAGGVALGGCGGSSDDDTTTQQSQNASATTGSDAMKDDGHAMKDDHEGAMKEDDAMKHEG